MSLQFIFGNPGSGKSHHLYKWIIEESIKNPQKNYVILVPEQFTMQTQKDLVVMHPNKGIMNIDVLSFGRLAYRVFEEVGHNQKIVLDDVGKNFVLRKLAGDREERFKVLRGNLKKLGYISEVKSVLSEFAQYDIGIEELGKMIEVADKESYLYWKMQDLALIYQDFHEYLEEKYITGEELLDVLCSVAKQSKILSGSVIALDGFTGFTPVQDRLLKEFMQICEKVMITITLDERENPYILRHKYQLFALSKETAINIVNIAKESGTTLDTPICLYNHPPYRFRNNESLGFLESEIFRHSQKQFLKPQDSIYIHKVKNPLEETAYVAREVRRLVRTKGYRYRDIAVIVSDMETYANYIEKTCLTYKIPIFMDHKRSVLLNSFVEYIRSLLFMFTQNFTYESVFRFLRTNLTGFTKDEIDAMENYVIALGIKGYKKWEEEWIRRPRGIDEVQLRLLNHNRKVFVEKIANIRLVFIKRKKTVTDISVALYEFLVQENMQQKMISYEEQFQKSGELVLAKEYAQIFRIVIELIDKFVELLGEESIPLKEYCDLLDAGFEEAKIGVIPPSLDQVVVGDIERTRLKDVKALFLIGINDTWIPRKQGQKGLLSERDRDIFEKEKIKLAPNGKEQVYIQKFYLYLNLTKPTEQLYLSYSKVTMEGKSLRPAYVIAEIKKLYPALVLIDEDDKTLAELELTKETGITYLIQGLRNRNMSISAEWLELYSWYRGQKLWSAYLEQLVEASFYKKSVDKLTEAMAHKLYGTILENSVTRLEQFSACAFSHFISYGLHLQERQKYEFEAMDLGNICHSAIERFSRKLVERGIAWTTASEEEKKSFVKESVRASIADYGNTVLYSSARNEYMITRIERMMNRTVWALTKQLEKGDFIPKGFEIAFGNTSELNVANIQLSSENQMKLRGKIDRIDICEEESQVFVKVIDYKTGAKAFDLTALYHGLQLQLVVYLSAALEMEQKKYPNKRILPAGIFYYQMKDPIVGKELDKERLQEDILKELKLDGLVNEDDNIIYHLDKELQGNSLVVPVGLNKDNSFSKASKIASTEEFETLIRFTSKTMEKIGTQILAGEAEATPYELGQKKGCDYCDYRDICRFDAKVEGYEYRKLQKYRNDEILQKMEEEE